MLVVVLGAGASHDSVPRPEELGSWQDYAPPLASDLFNARAAPFGDALEVHRMAAGAVGALASTVRAGTNVEVALESLQERAEGGNEAAASELAAVRYYLRDALWDCSTQWHQAAKRVTNYATLLHYLETWRAPAQEQVALVTFNYDVLLESALADRDIRFRDMHGVETTQDRQKALFPAIAIPTISKARYECPDDHINRLLQLIPSCDRLLVIGWAANDRHFLELLNRMRDRFQPAGLVVSNRDESALSTAERVTNALERPTSAFAVDSGGFSGLMANPLALEGLLGVQLR